MYTNTHNTIAIYRIFVYVLETTDTRDELFSVDDKIKSCLFRSVAIRLPRYCYRFSKNWERVPPKDLPCRRKASIDIVLPVPHTRRSTIDRLNDRLRVKGTKETKENRHCVRFGFGNCVYITRPGSHSNEFMFLFDFIHWSIIVFSSRLQSFAAEQSNKTSFEDFVNCLSNLPMSHLESSSLSLSFVHHFMRISFTYHHNTIYLLIRVDTRPYKRNVVAPCSKHFGCTDCRTYTSVQFLLRIEFCKFAKKKAKISCPR